jgi:NAD(P)-dependent dehydrogenase (short-subunit alcohol dehydrogenase family)
MMQPVTQNDPFSLRGQNALVVGGTRGIGRAISLELARAGARVIANYVREKVAADALSAEAQAEGLAIEVARGDVAADKGREDLLAFVGERFPELGTLVFAAATGVHKSFDGLSGRHFDFTFGLNVKAYLALVQGLAPRIATGGSIIAISSEGALHAMHHYTLVGASKAALESMSRHLAVELGPRGVRVNVISPGTVLTDAWKAMPDAETRLREAAARAPLGRLVTPEEVARCARFLASPAAAGISGHVLVVDGGARIRGAG